MKRFSPNHHRKKGLRREFVSLVPSTPIQRYDFGRKRRVNTDLSLSPSEPPSGGPLSSFLLEFAS